jgi:hypothetical protein
MNRIFKVFVELYDAVMTARKDDRYGRVVSTGSLSIAGIIEIAKSRRSDISPEVMLAVYHLLRAVALEETLGGKHVEFGLGFNSLLCDGVFIGDHPAWDPKKQKLVLSTVAASDVREAIKDVQVEVLGMAQSGLYINTLTDVTTEEVNTCITPGGGVNLVGVKIKVVGDEPGVGLYLVEINTSTEVAIPKASILLNDPSKIMFIVPADLPAGDYKLKIVTQYSTSGPLLKEARTYVFDYILECNIPDVNKEATE